MAGYFAADGHRMLRATGWYLVSTSIDLRCGMDRLLVEVQLLAGDTQEGGAYIFRNRSGTRIKMLLCDSTGVWLCTRRLHQGRFIWPQSGEDACLLSVEQFEWLCMGVDWQRLSTKPLAKIV